MKCARLHLQERTKAKVKVEPPTTTKVDKPRRYCQKRMVNPEHEEDPRWMDLWDRFRYNSDQLHDTLESARDQQNAEDLVLTVQTLQFQGSVDETKRPRTSFKYKTFTDGNKHRMFVKEIVAENEFSDEDRSSQQTYYYFDDYVKYLCNSDRSRPASGKSSIFLRGISKSFRESKATQVEFNQTVESKNIPKFEPKMKSLTKKSVKKEVKEEIRRIPESIDDAKITYKKTGKRKSLTISRTQSPETVQVIRVDVVCNYPPSSILSNYDETKKVQGSPVRSISRLENISVKHNHFANKYLLTNSIKSLDESLSGGSKVTLLCKTFKLSDRSPKASDKPTTGRGKTKKHMKGLKDVTRTDVKIKNQN